MAIQARLYSENNLVYPFAGDQDGIVGENSSHDLMGNGFGVNDIYLYNLQYDQQSSQPFVKNQVFCLDDNGLNKPSLTHSRSVAAQIQKENQETERFISLQHERLKLALQAHRKQQFLTILKNCESKSELLLRQKDEEIKQATNRRIQLEEILRKTDIERQQWQMVANQTEAMVINLNNKIEELTRDQVEDEGSCCNENANNANSNGGENKKKNICKSCYRKDSCVVMLPCRHLCSCKSCDAFLNTCPVCNMVKKSTIQLSFS
uniref:probable BOI-related E3 ubiquitin-protein ligase 2 n=1 Tax=Erigeron canadensis TaxID=72917 RepID=UPI001CB90446|nr:probable BOI-related E3 ubiquitin-protein ligase 2 [Erigeron canadensis]